MGARYPRATIRLALIIILNGLALWVLATALAFYLFPTSFETRGGGMVDTFIAVMARWTTTPGIGAHELLAYIGISLVLVGPSWYLIDRSWRKAGGGRQDRSGATKSNHFVFDDRPSGNGRRNEKPRWAGAKPQSGDFTGAASSHDWIVELFEGERSMSPPRVESPPVTNVTVDGADGNGGNGQLVVTSPLTARRVDSERVVASAPGNEEHADSHPDERHDATAVLGGDDASTTLPIDRRSADPVEGSAEADDEVIERHHDSFARLADDLALARERLETATNRMTMAIADRSATRAEEEVSAIVAEANEELAPLRDHDRDRRSSIDLAEVIPRLRANQRAIETAVRAKVGHH